MKNNKLNKPITGFPSLVFNTLEKQLSTHPIILFHDNTRGVYFYLKSRSADDEDNKPRPQYDSEVFVPKSGKRGMLFAKDSYIDCSQIFRIPEYELDDYLESNPEIEIEKVEELDYQYVMAIFAKMEECLLKKPPYMAYSFVNYNIEKDIVNAKIIYASGKHLKNDYSYEINKILPEEQRTFFDLTKPLKEQWNKLEKILSEEQLEKLAVLQGEKDIIQERGKKNWFYPRRIQEIVKIAKEKYFARKMYLPPARWILDNEANLSLWEKQKWTSRAIIRYINNLWEQAQVDPKIKPLTAQRISWYILDEGLSRLNPTKLEEIKKRDFEYMLHWFRAQRLEENSESLKIFEQQMEKLNPKEDSRYFNYYELERKLEKRIKDKTKDDGWSQGM